MRRRHAQAAATLASAKQWCDHYAPVFGGPPGESYESWIDRILEFGMAARMPGWCGREHDWEPWHRAHWRNDRVRRECRTCGQLEFGRLIGPFPREESA